MGKGAAGPEGSVAPGVKLCESLAVNRQWIQSVRIPIALEMRDDGSMRFPMMQIDFGCGTKGIHATALIDTGADLMAVDETVLLGLGCRRTGDVHGVRTVNGEKDYHRYSVFIEFPAIEAAAEIEVTGLNLTGKAYQAILGAPLLELGILHLDPRHESYFELFSDRLAPPEQ
jgi:predicted aspartyl protease